MTVSGMVTVLGKLLEERRGEGLAGARLGVRPSLASRQETRKPIA